MMARTSEPTNELIKRKLLVYKCYQMDVKYKMFFSIARQAWNYVSYIGFLACWILGIVESQIAMKGIFSWIEILIKLRKCHLQLNNLDKLIFVNKNWPNDIKVGCKSFSNLVEFITIDAYLEEELENLKEFLKGVKLWKYNTLD